MLLADIALLLLDILGSLVVGLLLLRAWIAAIGMPARNPLAHFARALTDWIVRPVSKLLPLRGRIDWATLLAALIVTILIVIANTALKRFPLEWDYVAVSAVRTLIHWALSLIMWVTLIHVIISWVNPLAPVAPALAALLRPLLQPIQRILPNLGGIDLSPMVLLIGVYILQMVVARAF